MNNLIVDKKYLTASCLAALIIVIVHNLTIDWYLQSIIIPFSLVLLSNIWIYKDDENINKKAYFMLIPIFLILISDPIIHLDFSNLFLNVFLLPILISSFFFLLINPYYHLSLRNLTLIFKLFPKGLIANLSLLKLPFKDTKSKKLVNTLLGLIIGGMISYFILTLLVSADDYFKAFVKQVFHVIEIDYSNIILFLIAFIIFFSISVNILKGKEIEPKEHKGIHLDTAMITAILSVINFVFILFLLSEISKLCGNFLQLPKGYIYSSYAREGFFQLLGVTSINYTILAVLLYRIKDAKNGKSIRMLMLTLIIFSLLLIFNSYYRMFLYIAIYGFTILRMQVILFLAMQIILFIFLIKKIVSHLKKDFLLFFITSIIFYIINLYICNDFVISIINDIL